MEELSSSAEIELSPDTPMRLEKHHEGITLYRDRCSKN